jgi:hypothetical protein
MMFAAQVTFVTYDEDPKRDTEGQFLVLGQAKDDVDFVNRVLPAKLAEVEKAASGAFTEFYLAAVVMTPDPLSQTIAIAYVEHNLRPERSSNDEYAPVLLDTDVGVAKKVVSDRIDPNKVFSAIGKPPARLSQG